MYAYEFLIKPSIFNIDEYWTKQIMKYIPPKKLKVLMALFFGTGVWGIYFGLTSPSQTSFMITFLGVINLCLGGFFGWVFLTQEPKLRDKRKE